MNRSLEALRGLAALLVVLSHCRLYPYLESQLPISGRSTIEKLLLVPTSFGRESVATFFVLSGYLVGGQVLRQVRESRFETRTFLVKRLSRFWVVLIPGLVFTVLIDAVSRATLTSVYPVDQGVGRSSWGTLACNVGMLMDNRCDPFGTNDSLWSLGYEFWFYLFFAAAVVGLYALVRRRRLVGALCLLAAAICVAAYGLALLWLIPAWLMGAVIADFQERRGDKLVALPRRLTYVAVVVLFLLGLLASESIDGLPVKYLLLGVTTSPLVLALGAFNPGTWLLPRVTAPVERTLVWLGTRSFTLYVFHLPFVMVLAVLLGQQHWPVNPLTVYVLGVLTVVVITPFYWVGEAHTGRVRDLLLAQLGVRRTRAEEPVLPPTADEVAQGG